MNYIVIMSPIYELCLSKHLCVLHLSDFMHSPVTIICNCNFTYYMCASCSDTQACSLIWSHHGYNCHS